MEKKTTVIGTSTDMTWEQLHSIDDLNTVNEFLTDQQKACLLLAQESGSVLLQLLLTEGYTNEFAEADGFQLSLFGEWIDKHFSATSDDILMKCSYIAAMNSRGIDPFEPEAA